MSGGGPSPPRLVSPVVALVSSTGGLEASSIVLEALPADFPAAVIVLQHQQPYRSSLLAIILARRARMPVVLAHDGAGLEPGRAHVVPPGRHAIVDTERRLRLLRTDGFPPPRPSADLLLATMAISLGAGAIAVVLSGHGHDGAVGVQAVDMYGGTVLVQDVGAHGSAGMPAAALRADRAGPPLPARLIAPELLDVVARVGPQL